MTERDAKRLASKNLQRLAFAHTLLGNEHKARAYKRVAWPVRQLDGELGELLASGALLVKPGFGSGVLRVLQAAVDGVEAPGLAELEAQLPPGLLEISGVRGLGAQRIKRLYETLGVSDLSELEYACVENRLARLEGFGQKIQDSVQAEVARIRSERGKFRRDHVLHLAEAIASSLRDGSEQPMVVGATRRGCELVRSLELLVVGDEELPPVESPIPVTLHRCTREDWGTRAVELSGSAEHLEALGELPVCASEAQVYRELGWLMPPPEQREGHVPLLRAGSPPPELVRREDLLGSLHNHTTASDGAHSIEDMREAALRAGLRYLAVTDHSVSADYAEGLEPERLARQVETIRALNEQEHGCVLLVGTESDILREGGLDYPPELLAQLDLVVASVHNRFGQRGETMTRRMATAATNPWVSVMGHPTGRLLLGRSAADYDLEAMLDAAARNGCAVELNSSPHRLDLNERHLAMARERGLLVSIAADAHSADQLAFLDYGVSIARRAGLRPDEVLNAMPLPELLRWLEHRRQRALGASA